jgi:phosphopantothenoylcysteine decarboxylase/phosphopantothenate--cysteine ligase
LAKAPAKIFSGKKIVITLGPTREKIDPVRFLSNYSSGKMGLAIAQAAASMGAEVTIIAGPTSIDYPDYLKLVPVESADDMLKAALKQSKNADIFIGCAAVADYKAQHYAAHKIKKHSDTLSLELAKTPDVIKEVKKSYPKLFCVAFAAETDNIKEYGVKKLREKNLDMVAINDVSENKVFGQDYNELHVITKSQKYFHLPRDTKAAVSRSLLELINANMN